MSHTSDAVDDETAYAALAAAVDDARWAFGTGFTDPLAGVDPTVRDGVDRLALAVLCVGLADDALVLSHRLQQWITRLPELEIETAVANIALDLLGQARRLYSRAGQVDGTNRSEDDFAFGRSSAEYRCVGIVEPPIEDFADLVVRLAMFCEWRLATMNDLAGHDDAVVAAIAGQAVKELTYDADWAHRWVDILARGTDLSRQRLRSARSAVEPLPASFGAAVRDNHTEHLTSLLEEMQSVARAHPGATW